MTSAQAVLSRWKEAVRNPFMTREFHLPKEVRGTPPNVDTEGTDLAIWKYEAERPAQQKTVYFAIAFQGKAAKPLWHHAFRDEAGRQRMIDETIRSRKDYLERRERVFEERRKYLHDLKEGDILYTSWGYDQTNVDYYQVVELRGKDLLVRQIAQEIVSTDRGTDNVVAVPGKFVKPAIRVRPTLSGVKIEGHGASKWDGKPQYQTPFGMGH